MKKYTAGQMGAIRSLAHIQMKEGIYLISVPMNEDQDMLTPWSDCTGRADFTDSEALAYWGEDVLTDFCEKALAYLTDDTVSDRYQ